MSADARTGRRASREGAAGFAADVLLAVTVGFAGAHPAVAGVAPLSSSFLTDLADTAHRQSILQVTAAGIAGGYADGTFRPGVPVTRGQMATFLARGLELPPAAEDPFVDVAGTTHAASVFAVASAGITGGYADGTFQPGVPVTRGQMATFLARGLELPPAAGDPFVDVAGTTHAASVLAVAAAGITGGYADGTFRPSEPVTRGQMATFLARALELPDVGPEYVVGDGVAADDLSYAEDAVEEAIAGIGQLTGYANRDLTVYLSAAPEELAEYWCSNRPDGPGDCVGARALWVDGQASAGVRYRQIFLNTGHDNWTGEDGQGGRYTAHQEYVLALAMKLAHPAAVLDDGVPGAGPIWLSHGLQSYLQTKLRFGDGFPFDRSAMRESALYDQPGRAQLRELETEESFTGAAPRLAQFAIYVLLEDFDVQHADLFGFYDAVGSGTDWQDAFEEVFGTTLVGFYDHFEGL